VNVKYQKNYVFKRFALIRKKCVYFYTLVIEAFRDIIVCAFDVRLRYKNIIS